MNESRVVTAHNVGLLVKELREARGLSQKELSLLAHIGQPMISKIESGEKHPSVRVFVRIIGALEASLVIQEEGGE